MFRHHHRHHHCHVHHGHHQHPCGCHPPSHSFSQESIRKVLVMPGTVLLREGSPGDSMIVISKGPDKMFCLRWRSCRLHFWSLTHFSLKRCSATLATMGHYIEFSNGVAQRVAQMFVGSTLGSCWVYQWPVIVIRLCCSIGEWPDCEALGWRLLLWPLGFSSRLDVYPYTVPSIVVVDKHV